jgi:hypothetical protein
MSIGMDVTGSGTGLFEIPLMHLPEELGYMTKICQNNCSRIKSGKSKYEAEATAPLRTG